ncbi:hypothetical protein EW146_g8433 [Bondarzewia mesenterica]|uniref:Uncharacterized protein n=1 Tax=Bondarzewia mesenterica TaxID=1095465 RepID=A0A4S4LEF4_9AGAM|nr:hypothetical protein EW146_g8433 [Bondarzewia mesenterica]
MTSTVDNPALASVHWQTTLVGSDWDHDHTRSSDGLTFDDLLATAAEYQTGTAHTPRENRQPTAPCPKNIMSLEAILSPVSSDYSSPSTGSGNHREARGPTNSARQTPQPQLEPSAHVPDQPQPCRVTTSPILPILVHPTPARRSLPIHPRSPSFTAPYIAPLPAPPTRGSPTLLIAKPIPEPILPHPPFQAGRLLPQKNPRHPTNTSLTPQVPTFGVTTGTTAKTKSSLSPKLKASKTRSHSSTTMPARSPPPHCAAASLCLSPSPSPMPCIENALVSRLTPLLIVGMPLTCTRMRLLDRARTIWLIYLQ